MRTGKIIPGILSMVLICLIAMVSFLGEPEGENAFSPSFYVCTETDGREEQIVPWKDSDGSYWIFLPGYARMEQTVFCSGADTVLIDGLPVSDGDALDRYEWNTTYSLSCSSEAGSVQSAVTFIRAEGIPSLYVDVASGSMEYIHMEKGNQESGTLRLYTSGGDLNYAGSLESVKGRGNSSWGADKKPYNLKLTQDADLLGMGSAGNWTLLAEGYNVLNIRNKIVYEFADEVGMPYAPDCEWVSLYMNGTYMGLYLLSERNEVHPERINIPQEGSFLISMESQGNLDKQKIPYLSVGSTQVLRVRHASMSEKELTDRWITLKNALMSETGADPVTGKHWQELIDMDSWVRKYLVEEVFGNPDGGVLSQFFYMDGADPEQRITAGPVWDYDYAMGGEDYWLKWEPNFLVLAREYIGNGMHLPWYYELYQKEAFRTRLAEIYRYEFLPRLHSLTDGVIEDYGAKIRPAAFCDGVRWGNSEEVIEEDLAFIKAFLRKRSAFLEDMWLGESRYHIVRFDPGRYGEGYLAVKHGDRLASLADYEADGDLGWYNADTGEPFDITQPVCEDVYIYIKKREAALPVIHYIPAVAITAALPILYLADRIKRKNGRRRNDPAKVNEISS